jgi:hypothetical protein
MYPCYKVKSMELGLPVIFLFDLRKTSDIEQFEDSIAALKPLLGAGFNNVTGIFRRPG